MTSFIPPLLQVFKSIPYPRSSLPSRANVPAIPQMQQAQSAPPPPFDPQHFLRNHWNQKPAHLPQLLPSFTTPITPDELAGLSLDATITSRIIKGSHPGPFTLQLGPFSSSTFESLPDANWTLLVSDVNKHVPPVARLLDNFSFIPNWRLDDVMVSYAAPGGSVGPHVDNYDVFLVQGSGRRLWRVGLEPITHENEHLLEDCDVRVLKDGFHPYVEWVLESGDVLYVPPRFPHHGISLDEHCMTYSVGFRAPKVADLVINWVEEVLEENGDAGRFYEDDVNDLVENLGDGGRITDTSIDNAFSAVMAVLAGGKGARERFRDWFAKEVSQPKAFREELAEKVDIPEDDADDIIDIVASGGNIRILQQEGCVFTYVENAIQVWLYVDGEKWLVDNVEIAKALCNQRALDTKMLVTLLEKHPPFRDLLKKLIIADVLYVEQDHISDEKRERDDSNLSRHFS